jgi:hypothetical protein
MYKKLYIIQMTSIIKVKAFYVKPHDGFTYYGAEPGTPEFYHVADILEKYLGETNIGVSWDYNDGSFIIQQREEPDEGCDNTYDYIQNIQSIWEPVDYKPEIFDEEIGDHLVFKIIYDE